MFLLREHKARLKAVEADKKQEKLAQDQFEKHCHDFPRSKFARNFQAYIDDHKVWPYPSFSQYTRWTDEKDRKTALLTCKAGRLALAAGTTASMTIILVKSTKPPMTTRTACAQ